MQFVSLTSSCSPILISVSRKKMASLTPRNLYPGTPNTRRGEPTHISASPISAHIAYPSNKCAVIRSIDSPLDAQVFSLHTAPVTCAAFSPCGTRVASGDENGHVRVWEAATQSQKSEYFAMNGAIRDIKFSADGKFLVLAGDSRGAYGKVVKVIGGGSAGVCGGHTKRGLSCDIGGGVVVTGSEDMTVGVFKGPPVRELDIPKFLKFHSGFINDVKISPDAKLLAIASSDRTVSILDMEKFELVCKLEGHVASVTGLAWMQGDRLMTSSNDKTTRVWKIPEGVCESDIVFGKEVTDMQVGCAVGTGGEMVSISLRPQINVVAKGSNEVTGVLRGHSKQIVGLAAVDHFLYTADYSGLLVAWEVDHGAAETAFNGKGPATSVCAIAANEDVVASVGQDGKIFVTPRKTLSYMKPVTVKGGGVGIAVARVTGSDFSAVMVNETRLTAVNSAGDDVCAELKFERGETGTCVAVAGNGSLIAVGFEMNGGNGEMRFYKVNGSNFVQAGENVCMPSAPNRIAFSGDGDLVAVGEKSRRVKMYNAATRSSVTGGGLAHSARVDAICFSPDGMSVASGGMDGSLAVWPVDSEDEPVRVKSAHRNGVTGIAYVNEGVIATSGSDACVRTWNL